MLRSDAQLVVLFGGAYSEDVAVRRPGLRATIVGFGIRASACRLRYRWPATSRLPPTLSNAERTVVLRPRRRRRLERDIARPAGRRRGPSPTRWPRSSGSSAWARASSFCVGSSRTPASPRSSRRRARRCATAPAAVARYGEAATFETALCTHRVRLRRSAIVSSSDRSTVAEVHEPAREPVVALEHQAEPHAEEVDAREDDRVLRARRSRRCGGTPRASPSSGAWP